MVNLNDVRKVISYNPETGDFTWTVDRTWKIKAGMIAGHTDKAGYRTISLLGGIVFAHRLAFFMTYGRMPVGQIDHINRVRSDNRICNLREADSTLNQHNRVKTRRNTTGVVGVVKLKNRYVAQIGVDGKRKYLGLFSTVEEASAAYQAAKLNHHVVNVIS